MKHDQVSERGVTSVRKTAEEENKGGKRSGREFLSLFLRVVDIRTRIRHLVE